MIEDPLSNPEFIHFFRKEWLKMKDHLLFQFNGPREHYFLMRGIVAIALQLFASFAYSGDLFLKPQIAYDYYVCTLTDDHYVLSKVAYGPDGCSNNYDELMNGKPGCRQFPAINKCMEVKDCYGELFHGPDYRQEDFWMKVWRTAKLRVGDETNKGMIIEIKRDIQTKKIAIVKIQTSSKDEWYRVEEIYPKPRQCDKNQNVKELGL